MKIFFGGYNGGDAGSFPFSNSENRNYHVLHLLHGKGEYVIASIPYALSSGFCILISPEISYSYSSSDQSFSDDWICFQLEKGEALPSSLICNMPFQLNDFDHCALLIKQLLWENSSVHNAPPNHSSGNINALFYVLLNHLSAACYLQSKAEKRSPYLHKFQLLRLQILNSLDEEHTITRHATQLCMSTSHFQHLYSQFFGISFQNDLIRMRITHAETLLQNTYLSMEQIAEACGYSNSTHFFRQFKQIKGVSPAKCRKASHFPRAAATQSAAIQNV